MAESRIFMGKMIQEIYKNLMQELDEDEISRVLKNEVVNLIGDENSYPDAQTYGEYRDKAFAIAEAGEEAGFCRGFCYAFQLFMECR